MNYKLLTTVGEFRMEQNQDKRKNFTLAMENQDKGERL